MQSEKIITLWQGQLMPQYYCENFRGITEHLEESLDTLRLITGRRGSPMFFFLRTQPEFFFFFGW